MNNQFIIHQNSGLTAGGQNFSKERQNVSSKAVNPITSCIVQSEEVAKTPRHSVSGRKTACSQKRIEVLSNKMVCCHFPRHAPSSCISKVVVIESGEIICEKRFVSSRQPSMISFKDNWMKNWIQKLLEAAKTPNKPNQNQKPNDQER